MGDKPHLSGGGPWDHSLAICMTVPNIAGVVYTFVLGEPGVQAETISSVGMMREAVTRTRKSGALESGRKVVTAYL